MTNKLRLAKKKQRVTFQRGNPSKRHRDEEELGDFKQSSYALNKECEEGKMGKEGGEVNRGCHARDYGVYPKNSRKL